MSPRVDSQNSGAVDGAGMNLARRLRPRSLLTAAILLLFLFGLVAVRRELDDTAAVRDRDSD